MPKIPASPKGALRHLNALEVKFFGLPAEGARTGIQDLRLLGGRDRARPPLGPRPHGPGPGFGPPSRSQQRSCWSPQPISDHPGHLMRSSSPLSRGI